MNDLWRSDTLARVRVARRRIRDLRELTDGVFPRGVISTGVHGDWPLTGWAMLARIGGTADSIVALIPHRRATDGAVLTRTLYESVVTFAWIGIDPVEHAQAWLRWDRRQRLKADNDVIDSGAPALLEPDARATFEALVALGPPMPDDLSQCATAVDRHWGPGSTASTKTRRAKAACGVCTATSSGGSRSTCTPLSPRSSRSSSVRRQVHFT